MSVRKRFRKMRRLAALVHSKPHFFEISFEVRKNCFVNDVTGPKAKSGIYSDGLFHSFVIGFFEKFCFDGFDFYCDRNGSNVHLDFLA